MICESGLRHEENNSKHYLLAKALCVENTLILIKVLADKDGNNNWFSKLFTTFILRDILKYVISKSKKQTTANN